MALRRCFNPHRSRRTGATSEPRPDKPDEEGFNPHRSRRTGATDERPLLLTYPPVSILTGPEGPVQHGSLAAPPGLRTVSILTGPEGPVQPAPAGRWPWRYSFQSSPVPKDRCNHRRGRRRPWRRVSILTGPEGPVQLGEGALDSARVRFQSSPVPKDRCNRRRRGRRLRAKSFNPHRSRRTGATEAAGGDPSVAAVSILTGPEGPVQPVSAAAGDVYETVSILTGPEGPVQPGRHHPAATSWRFNPHRSRRTGATATHATLPYA